MEVDMEPSSSNEDQLCKLCNISQRRYVCPKCGIPYCSMECYKSTGHLECSELFYKQCVEEELQVQECDPEVKQKTLDILQRIYNDDADDNILNDILHDDESEDYEADLDSDDENIPSLEKRLQNVNLDNADELWSALTATEKQEFEALIESGEASKLLPTWNPWWTYSAKKKLITDLAEKGQEQVYVNNCPKILDIPALESIVKTSPFVRYSIINVVYAYAYCSLHFNGEHHSTPLDTVYILLRICDTMRVNRIFKDSLTAVESVLLQITNCDSLPGDQDTILGTKHAGDAILNGPEENNKCFYILALLSDLYQALQEAKKEITIQKTNSTNSTFKSKFQSNIDLSSVIISKRIFLCIQKDRILHSLVEIANSSL